MTVIVMFPRNASSQIREAITLAVGIPINRVYKDHDDLYFYPDDDRDEVHFKISQYISRVYRRKQGHGAFMELHDFFNKNVKVLSENEYAKLYFNRAA